MYEITCCVCASSRVKRQAIISRDDELIDLIKCQNCGHLSQDLSEYEDIYTIGEFSKIARSAEPTIEKVKSLDKRAYNRIKYYKKILDDFDNVLEIGSSIGSFVHAMKLSGKKAQGLEPDPIYANYSSTQYGFEQYASIVEDFETVDNFDGVVSFHVLEHVKDPKAFLKKCHSLLNINGKLLFEFPSLDLHSYGSMKQTIWKPHIHYFTISSLYHLFASHFQILRVGHYGSALYVYAQKSDCSTFKKNVFRTYKLKSKLNYLFCEYFPSIPIKLQSGITAKQLILQSLVFQHNKIDLFRKFVKLGVFAIKNIFYLKGEKSGSKQKATHISYYSGWENAGDTVLSKCVRDIIKTKTDASWNLQKLTSPVVTKSINEINRSKFLLLGGGGVLLPDSNPNSISGWQWAVSKNQLDSIKVPVLIYAIGYNYFPGQKPSQLFIDNLNHIIEKASFFSIRNKGSIRSISELISSKYVNKIHFQPCPTTIIRKFDNIDPKRTTKNIGVNIAYDRYKNRFGDNIYHALDQIALSLKAIENQGYKIFNICHLENDSKFELSLDQHNINYQTIQLQYALPSEVYNTYNNMELVMGMRGHAQMIPFGLNCKIISLGSHNKLKWFLEDIDATDWYVDINDPHLKESILSHFDTIINDKNIKDRLITQQEILYKQTCINLEKMSSLIS